MQIAFVTVNFNTAPLTIKLLESLLSQCDEHSTVIIIDNASSPEDVEQLAVATRNRPRCALIAHNENGGFAAGCNIGIRAALADGADWIVLVNSDTVAANGFMRDLRRQLENRSGIVAIPLKEGDRVAYCGIIKWLCPTLSHLYDLPTDTQRLSSVYAIGGGMAIHRDVFYRIGFLDERYFLYFEDADFSCRARQADLSVSILEQLVLSHAVSSTTKRLGSPQLLRLHYRNAMLFNIQRGPFFVKLAVPLWATALFKWHLCKAVFRPSLRAQSMAIVRGILDFFLRRYGPITDNIKHIGIECEQLEGESWGIRCILAKLLENIAHRPELAREFKFHLYFKSSIPDYSWIDNPIFQKEIIRQPFPHKSFVLYYYVFLPIRLWFSGLKVMFYPNYMMPIIHPPWMPSLALMTEDIWYEMRSPHQSPHHRLAYWVFGNWAAKFATKILAISESSKHELARLFGIVPERIEIAHLAADAPCCQIENNCYGDYILYVAQAFPRRHLRETVEAFEKISEKFPDLKLIAIGPDKYRPSLIIKNDKIIRREYVSNEELAALYKHAKAFVYVSDREAFGLPPLEALSYGVPSVLADKPIGREIFGEHAFFAKTVDKDGIAEELHDTLINTAKCETIRAAASEILSRFTWSAFTSRWLEIIKKPPCNKHEGE